MAEVADCIVIEALFLWGGFLAGDVMLCYVNCKL